MSIGRVRHGAASLQGYKEDRRNVAKPVHPIFYPGGYSSHGPTYDSTFANLTPQVLGASKWFGSVLYCLGLEAGRAIL